MSRKRTHKTVRLAARVHPELRVLIRRAAVLEGRTVAEFVISALQTAVQRAIGQSQVLRIAAADQVRFARALIAPRTPAPALKRAFARRRTLTADKLPPLGEC